jgi:predicted TIM-barrel fold metal-dependent hydrolase
MIVDTHVHAIADDRGTYPKVPDAYDWPDLTGAALLATMDRLGIDRATLVQPYFTYHYDNAYQIDCARAHPDRFAVVCVIDIAKPDAPDTLSRLVEDNGVRGVRMFPGREKGLLDDPKTFPVWERAVSLGIPITVACNADELHKMPAVVASFPKAKAICFEHMWGVRLGKPPYADDLAPILALAGFPNVRLKLCPNNSYAVRETGGKPTQFYGALVDAFGARRIMWGSNYPAHWDHYGKIEDRLPLAREDFAFLPEADRRAVLGETALTVWPWLK